MRPVVDGQRHCSCATTVHDSSCPCLNKKCVTDFSKFPKKFASAHCHVHTSFLILYSHHLCALRATTNDEHLQFSSAASGRSIRPFLQMANGMSRTPENHILAGIHFFREASPLFKGTPCSDMQFSLIQDGQDVFIVPSQ